MDSDSNETFDECDSIVSSNGFDYSSSDDDDSLIEGLDQSSIDEWQ